MSFALALCLLATAELPTAQAESRLTDCVQLAHAAGARGHDQVLIVSLALEESKLHAAATSRCGARGILQALPKWHCPGGVERDCDLTDAGLSAVERWQRRVGADWLCHYNAGNVCGAKSRAYARRISRRARSWQTRLDAAMEVSQ